MRMSSRQFPSFLLVAFGLIWVALAAAPWYPQDWWLENVLVVIAVPLLVWRHVRRPFSNAAYGCLFLFGVLHIIGAHYTYSEVPYEQWSQTLTGRSAGEFFGWTRNHYDRLVHLAYGGLLAAPAVELLDSVASPRRQWRWMLPVLFLMSHSVIYEIVEWIAAEVFGGELGQAYLGTQGDQWDSQKDMALAAAGALFAVLLIRYRGRIARSATAVAK